MKKYNDFLGGLLAIDYEISMASSLVHNGMEQNENKVMSLISKSAEPLKHQNQYPNNRSTSPAAGFNGNAKWHTESSLYLDAARLLLSLTHAWNLDDNLDPICLKSLKLLKPRIPICYGTISRKGKYI